MAPLWKILPIKGAEEGAGRVPPTPERQENRLSLQAASRAYETRDYYAEDDKGQ
jgi:hypothetical protein